MGNQTDNFDNLHWIETKDWKYKCLQNIYFGLKGTFRQRGLLAAMGPE